MSALTISATAQGGEQTAGEGTKRAPNDKAQLVVWNHPIAVFSSSFAGLPPRERAAQAAERIEALPVGSESGDIKLEQAKIGSEEGVAILLNSRVLFFLTKADLALDSKESLDHAAQAAVRDLREALRARTEQGSASTLVAGLTQVLIATLVFLIFIWLLRRFRIWSAKRMEVVSLLPERYAGLVAADLRTYILQAARAMIRLFSLAVIFVLAYLWLVYCLQQFSYTSAWGEDLGQFILNLSLEFGRGALGAVPGLFAVVIVILIARWCARLINTIFKQVETGKLSLPWFERETARTTQTLLIVVVWLFALVVAYPYIPGSDTDAFKGLSVLIGLMVTLGSTGLINQVISGLFVTYSRSVRPEDYVRIGDVEGEVISVGSLATKLRTPRQEEVTLPHSVLVGTAITNYSRLAGNNGMVAATSVTIGYDVPWRQVHALLLLGASRTPGIRQEPPPRVLQRELSDFYVQYQLLAHLEEGASRAAVLSELHSQIQDAFNEHGVQIMSPHFESQPERKVFVPKTGWYAASASPDLHSES